MPIINLNESRPTYCTACLICDAIIEEYDIPAMPYPKICDKCKEAVAFAKWLKSLPAENWKNYEIKEKMNE